MKTLAGTKELYDYLVFLTTELKDRKSEELSKAVDHARLCSASNISTEFLGESRIALRKVRDEETTVLSADERADLLNVLRQLDQALDRR